MIYNLALVPPAALGYLVHATSNPDAAPEITPMSAVGLFALCVLLANLCYSTAYLLELLLQRSPPESRWPLRARAVALAVGTAIGMGAAFRGAYFIALVQYE